MRALYVETSILGQAYLHEVPDARTDLHGALSGRRVFTSALTAVELRCAIMALVARRRVQPRDAAELQRRLNALLSQWDPVPLEPGILARAGEPFGGGPVRTLDALHLASALEVLHRRQVTELVMISRDARVRDNAAALGMQLA